MISKKPPSSKRSALPRIVGGDFLLMYRIEATPQGEAVVFVRCGTHADLFDE